MLCSPPRLSACRYRLPLTFFCLAFIPVSYFNVEGHVLSGVLNLIYVVSEAAAPAEPWEGRGDAASLLPPLCPVPSRGLRAMLAVHSAPLGPHGPLGWSGGGVPWTVQGHFPFLKAVATHHHDIFESYHCYFRDGKQRYCNSRRCSENGREISQFFKGRIKYNSETHDNPYGEGRVINLGFSWF